jgi:hypothetical protein
MNRGAPTTTGGYRVEPTKAHGIAATDPRHRQQCSFDCTVSLKRIKCIR